MQLQQTIDGLSRAVPVILTTGLRMWAEQGELEYAAGVRIVRNRKGRIVRALAYQHIEAATASHIGSHTKGQAYRELSIGGNLWALTGTPGARR